MADAREGASWEKTSFLLAAIHNWASFGCEQPQPPRYFNPYLPAEEEDEREIDAADLALMLCGQEAIDMFAAADATASGT